LIRRPGRKLEAAAPANSSAWRLDGSISARARTSAPGSFDPGSGRGHAQDLTYSEALIGPPIGRLLSARMERPMSST